MRHAVDSSSCTPACGRCQTHGSAAATHPHPPHPAPPRRRRPRIGADNERRLVRKCRELNSEIVTNAAKVRRARACDQQQRCTTPQHLQPECGWARERPRRVRARPRPALAPRLRSGAQVATALKLSEEDQATIAALKREIEKSWKLVDAAHDKVQLGVHAHASKGARRAGPKVGGLCAAAARALLRHAPLARLPPCPPTLPRTQEAKAKENIAALKAEVAHLQVGAAWRVVGACWCRRVRGAQELAPRVIHGSGRCRPGREGLTHARPSAAGPAAPGRGRPGAEQRRGSDPAGAAAAEGGADARARRAGELHGQH